MSSPWNREIAAIENAVQEASAALKDLPFTPEIGRCRRALARARDRNLLPAARMEILQGVREDLKALGFKERGALP